MTKTSWLGDVGNWGNAKKWSGGVPDSASADATIAASGPVNLASGDSYVVGQLTIDASVATLNVLGTLNLDSDLDLESGRLALQGTIGGGTIVNTGGAFVVSGTAAAFVGVDYEGTLDLTASRVEPNTFFNISNGLTMQGSGGEGAGSINIQQLNGGMAALWFHGTGTLSNATVDIGKGGGHIFADAGTLTIAPNVSIEASGEGEVFLYSTDFTGAVVNEGTISTGPGGMIVGSFESFTNDGSMSFDGQVDAAVVNSGTITASGNGPNSGIFFLQSISGAGQLEIGARQLMSFDTSIDASQNVVFEGAAGVIRLFDPAGFAATVSAFVAGDAIDLVDAEATSVTLQSGDNLVVSDGSTVLATIQLSGDYSSARFWLRSDGEGGTKVIVTFPPPSAAPAALVQAMAAFEPEPASAHAQHLDFVVHEYLQGLVAPRASSAAR